MMSDVPMGHRLLIMLAWLAAGCTGRAATITLDLNGFPNSSGAHVAGPGMPAPVQVPAGVRTVVLENLQAGGTYGVDFFHDAGCVPPDEGTSDFTFQINAGGTGVESVSLGGGRFLMVDAFLPGTRTLKLRTVPVVLNANSGQTGTYIISGLMREASTNGSGPVRALAVPGNYTVDNLYNSSEGREDFHFSVGDDGVVRPAVMYPLPAGTPRAVTLRSSAEFAEFVGNEVRPRSARVRIRMESATSILWNPTHACTATNAGTVTDVEMAMPIAGGGVNIWSFGTNRVTGGTLVKPFGHLAVGTGGPNDFVFCPFLRWNRDTGQFYFVTTRGPDTTVTAEVEGFLDDGTTPLKVMVSATILDPR